MITPVWSGQVENMKTGVPRENVWGVWRISRAGLRALMEIEIVNTTGKRDGYLVIDGQKLTGIKPHKVDATITFGFGDSLQDDDLAFYQGKEGITGFISDSPDKIEEMKNTVIPVQVCFDKLVKDTTEWCQVIFNDLGTHFLTQNQLDAVVIFAYNHGAFPGEVKDAILDGVGREELFGIFMRCHGTTYDLSSRAEQEMNIYFDRNYFIEQGLRDVIVEPLDSY